jgi:hypothetical protein
MFKIATSRVCVNALNEKANVCRRGLIISEVNYINLNKATYVLYTLGPLTYSQQYKPFLQTKMFIMLYMTE